MPARRRGGVLARPTLSILSAVALVTCIAVVVVRRSSVSSLTPSRSESDGDTEEQYEDAAGGVPVSELPQHGTADAVSPKVHVGGQTRSSKEEVEVDGRTVRVRPHPMDEGSRADLTVARQARRRWKDAPVLEKHNSTLSCAATAAATVAWRRMTPEKMFEPDPHSSPRALKDAQERAGATPAKKPRFHASCAVRLPTM